MVEMTKTLPNVPSSLKVKSKLLMTTFIVNLEMKLVSFVIVSLVFSSALTAAAKHHFTVDKTVFDALLQRLGTLEAKDNEKQEKIQLLEQEVLKMKKASEEDRKEIDRLKREVKQQNDLCKKVLGHMETDIKKVHLYSDLTDYREPQALDYDEAEVKFGATRTNANERQPKIKRHADQDEIRNRGARMENEHRVAFFASVTPHDVAHLGALQPIVFDNAVLNIGNAYRPASGIFTAPYYGVYVFTTTIFGRLDGGVIYFDLSKNGVHYANFEIKDSHQVTHSVILDLKPGDDVSVRNYNNDHAIVGHNYTTFSGFLLYENYPPQTVG